MSAISPYRSLAKICLLPTNPSFIRPNLVRRHHYSSSSKVSFQATSNITVFEIANGVGGSEAMLFANDMFEVYTKYFTHMRWPYALEELVKSDLG